MWHGDNGKEIMRRNGWDVTSITERPCCSMSVRCQRFSEQSTEHQYPLHSFNFPSLLQHLDYIYIESSAAVASAHAYRKMSVSFRKADLVATGLLPPHQHMEPAACTLPVYTGVILLWWPRLVSMVPVEPLIQLIAGVH